MHFRSSWRNATAARQENVAAITEIVTYAIFPGLVSQPSVVPLIESEPIDYRTPLHSVYVGGTPQFVAVQFLGYSL